MKRKPKPSWEKQPVVSVRLDPDDFAYVETEARRLNLKTTYFLKLLLEHTLKTTSLDIRPVPVNTEQRAV